jgi:hypothetical protein
MDIFNVLNLVRERALRWPGILGIIIIVGILAYLGYLGWKQPEALRNLPATVSRFAQIVKEKLVPKEITEEEVQEEVALETLETPEFILPEEKTYTETAQWGEGITHLARRALRNYLSEKPQNFEVTPEHKIYIEDYIAKKLGGGWLTLGEKMEISGKLLQEAIDASSSLTPEQLQNLTQFSQLVPSLSY